MLRIYAVMLRIYAVMLRIYAVATAAAALEGRT